jgi:hypothetical protein
MRVWGRAGRATATAGVLVLVAVAAVSGCSASGDEPDGPGSSAAPATDVVDVVEGDVVGEDGLSLDVAGVRVEFPAGSATGAVVDSERVPLSQAPTSTATGSEVDAGGSDEQLGTPLVPLEDGVMIALDAGSRQPSAPVTVTFPLSEDLLAEVPVEGDEPDAEDPQPLSVGQELAAGNIAFAVQSDDGSVEVVPAAFDPSTGTVSGDVPHFSGIWPVRFDVDSMVDDALLAVGAVSERPACEGTEAQVGGETYSVVSDPLMWMCVEPTTDGAGVVVKAQANAAFPFIARPDVVPDVAEGLTDLSSTGVATHIAVDVLRMVPDGKVAVFPGGLTSMTYDEAPGEVGIQFVAAPNLLLVSVLSEVAATALGVSGAEFGTLIGRLDCMQDVGALFREAGEGAFTPAVASNLVTAFFSCAGEIVEDDLAKKLGVVAALLQAAPQLLIGTLWGAITTAAGASTLDIVVRARGGVDGFTAADIEPFVGTWSGPVSQPGSRYYGMEVTIGVDADGRPTAQVRYPELGNCSGYWDDPRLSGRTLRVVEHIETSVSSCVPVVELKVRRVGEKLRYWTVGSYDAKATLSRGPYEPPAPATTWPVGKDEGPPGLMTWLGANLYAFPDWVACDDARAWCLVGGSTEHMVVQVKGLVDRGRVSNRSTAPIEAMVRLGVPRSSAMQIMD